VAQREAEAFGPLLRSIRDELGLSVLIVEHDMPLLMGLCDRIYAMDQGRVISEGTPEEVREDPAVIVSYLGTDEAPASPPTREIPVHQAAEDASPSEPTGPVRERPLRARPLRAR
jgi:ABC-type glutathione transport system ATPase component